MTDPFFVEIEAAYQTVSTYPHMQVSVERGDKAALVRFVQNAPDTEGRGAIYIKVTEVQLPAQVVELNPNAKKEA